MRQFTMNIDDSLLQAAKAHALSTGRSVSDIVRDLLAREVGWSAEQPLLPPDDAGTRPVLQAYAAGKLTRRQAMDRLGLPPDRYPDFASAMNRLSVPWPKPDPAQIEREADLVVQAIRDARGED
jgi:negative regulator of replication initiation